MILPDGLLELLRAPSTCYIATLMRDGSPQLTQVWVDTDGEHVIVNSVDTHLKVRNIRRDPRVALTISDPAKPRRFFQVRGRALSVTKEGGPSTSTRSRRSTAASPMAGTAAATRCA